MKKRIMLILAAGLMLTGCQAELQYEAEADSVVNQVESYSMENIPEYDGNSYVVIDDNEPSFTEAEITDEAYEYYSELDELGRCGVAEACIGEELMPTEARGSIGHIKPTGWQTVKYDFVDGKYLYNRCHLIGFQLTGENDNEKNLITGTRYMNVEEMLVFENMVDDYIEDTGNHVMYRVTPIFEGDNLLATGVEMEGYSVEDEGEGISFHVFCYNVQPNVEIDYETGYSWASDEEGIKNSGGDDGKADYVINTNSQKFHTPDCSSVKDISESNKQAFYGKRADLIDAGYEPCGRCKP